MGMGAKGPLTDDGIDRPCQTEAVSCLLSCTRPSLICMHPHEAQISEPVDHVLWSAPNYNPHAPATGHLLDVVTNHHRPGLAVASARPRRMASWHAGKLGREQLIDVYISRALSACNLDQPAPRRPGVSGKPREEGAGRREFNCSRFVHAAKPIRKALVVVPFLTCTNLVPVTRIGQHRTCLCSLGYFILSSHAWARPLSPGFFSPTSCQAPKAYSKSTLVRLAHSPT